jgi:hypothetical protein
MLLTHPLGPVDVSQNGVRFQMQNLLGNIVECHVTREALVELDRGAVTSPDFQRVFDHNRALIEKLASSRHDEVSLGRLVMVWARDVEP